MRTAVKIAEANVDFYESSLILNSRLGKRISTAQFDIEGEERWTTPSLAIARVNANGGYTKPQFRDEVIIDKGVEPMGTCGIIKAVALGGKSDYLDHFFGGYLSSVEERLTGVRKFYRCTAQDFNILPLERLVTKSYTDKTNKEIIDDLFTTYLSQIDTSEVEEILTDITIDWTRVPLSEVLDELAKIYDQEWYIGHDKKLQFFTPVTTAAPFGLSDNPYLSIKFPYANFQHVENLSRLVNKVLVIGDTGAAIVVTRTDATSYARYKRWDDDYCENKIVDHNIDTEAWAELVGDAYLAEHAYAKVKGKLTINQEGLVVGQKVRVENLLRNIDDYYLIQSLKLSMVGALTERVEVEYGDYSPKLADLLLRINKEERKEE